MTIRVHHQHVGRPTRGLVALGTASVATKGLFWGDLFDGLTLQFLRYKLLPI